MSTLHLKKSVEQGQSKYFITLENLRNILNVLRTAAKALPYQRFNLQASGHNAPHPPVAHSGASQSSPGQPSGAPAVQQQQDVKFTPKLPQAIPSIPQTPQIPPAPQIHRTPQIPPAQPHSQPAVVAPVQAGTQSQLQGQSQVQTSPRPPSAARKPHPTVPSPAEAGPSTATPPAHTATPAAVNPPTPSHVASSPQTPRSPRGKTAKPRTPAKRRSNTKTAVTPAASALTPAAASTPAAPPTPATAPTPTNAAVPMPSPAMVPAQSPAADLATSSGASAPAGIKREREEELLAASELPPSAPSPKKVKTEWEGPPSEALIKKQAEVESIQTDEDAAKFYEGMAELFRTMSSEHEQDMTTLSQTLDEILKGYPGDTELSNGAGPSSPSRLPEPDESEFLDFTYCMEEDTGSKAPTPELQASSTNPSPGSGSDSEGGHGSSTGFDPARIASDDIEEVPDVLRLGLWKEIDGGESAYYQGSDAWKWDGMMPSEQGWPIFDS
ncbi:uncharacterized protein LAESUDRAFT_759655 [Laetiporus sulphureus 93-53]|uniref:Uncharacterized protein n=1 Tax=Laetiporus sulphureus 93-53 TaxID=1314785 RepID=A0A165E2L2_9APHY|nr:uncharacterized protein LAESUDRAFT_759655 [Laetiporus sulphureus 93-53]KZT06125.1 hypothetical protein LAESUDRAFT_759655 [Laetiporus sulphureus 93-53]